ncbi:MAG: hypothetical protein ACO331_00780 [Prochlorothrix sp.]
MQGKSQAPPSSPPKSLSSLLLPLLQGAAQLSAHLTPPLVSSLTTLQRLGGHWRHPRHREAILGQQTLPQTLGQQFFKILDLRPTFLKLKLQSLLWVGLGLGLGAEVWLWDWQLALAGAIGLGGLLGADRLRQGFQTRTGQQQPPWQRFSAPQQFLVLAVAGSSLAAMNTYWLTVVWTDSHSPGLTAGLVGQSLALWALLALVVRPRLRSAASPNLTAPSPAVLTEQLQSAHTIVRLGAVQAIGQGLGLQTSPTDPPNWQPDERPWAVATLQCVANTDPEPGVRQLASWHLQILGFMPHSQDSPQQMHTTPLHPARVNPALTKAVPLDSTPLNSALPRPTPIDPAPLESPAISPESAPLDPVPVTPHIPRNPLQQQAWFDRTSPNTKTWD